jgi:RNA polymerase sigma-70 factor (ECF subfamily)
MDEHKEAELLRRLQARDEQAFVECVRLHQGKVYGLVLRMLGSRHEAEDVAQEVFVTLFKSIDGFRGDSRLGTWIYRIAVNHCKNRLKYLKRRAHKSTSELDETAERALYQDTLRGGSHAQQSTLGQADARPDELLVGQQLGAILQKAITVLDEDQRTLLVLRDVEELAYDEIMAITGLPEGTVKSRLHRARQLLKAELARHTK